MTWVGLTQWDRVLRGHQDRRTEKAWGQPRPGAACLHLGPRTLASRALGVNGSRLGRQASLFLTRPQDTDTRQNPSLSCSARFLVSCGHGGAENGEPFLSSSVPFFSSSSVSPATCHSDAFRCQVAAGWVGGGRGGPSL